MKKNWTYKKLGEVCEIYQPKTISTEMLCSDGEYLVYGANGVIGRYNQYNHEESEVLMTCRGATCGTINISEPHSWINGNAMVIHPKTNDTFHSRTFLVYLLRSLDLSTIITGCAQPQITRMSLAPLTIPIPPLSIQSRIVSELDLLQSIIDKQQAQLKELDTLAQAVFYDMFGDPVENEKGWEVKKLGEVGRIARGVSKHRPRNAPELLGNYMPFIQTGDIANSGMYITDCQSGYSELGVAQSKIWHKGTLCITIAANIGKCAIMTFDACFPDSVVGFIAMSNISLVEYVYYFFLCVQKDMEENAMGVAQKNINLAILNSMNIPVPPLSLQQSFAQKIESIERQKELINQSIREARALFDSRMEYYFGV